MSAVISFLLSLPKIIRIVIPIVDTVITGVIKVRNGIVFVLYNGNADFKKILVTKEDFNNPSKTI